MRIHPFTLGLGRLTGLCLLAAVLTQPITAAAAIIASETFAYPNGPLIGQGTAVDGFTGEWMGMASGFQMVDGNLVLSAGGFMDSVSRALEGNMPPVDGGSLYAAIDLELIGLGDGGIDIFNILFRAGDLGSYWAFGLSGTTFSVNGGASGGVLAPNTVYRLVSRMTRNDAGNDEVVVWVNPLTESDAPLLTSSEASFIGARSALTSVEFSLSEFGMDALRLDSLIIGTRFSDVTPVPEPGSVWGLSLLALPFLARLRRRTLG